MALTKQQLLDDARMKLHSLMVGTAVVEFKDQNGETVRYTAANAPRLAAYVRQLEIELGQVQPSRPAGVMIG